eukprot:1080446-Pleurochrysis_carterae.AAC.1
MSLPTRRSRAPILTRMRVSSLSGCRARFVRKRRVNLEMLQILVEMGSSAQACDAFGVPVLRQKGRLR